MEETDTLFTLRKKAAFILQEAKIAEADLDAWYLLEHVTNFNRASFFLKQEECLTKEQYACFFELVQKRASRIPLQYLTGSQQFMGLDFQVTKDVLIPRQDTECLVERALLSCQGKRVLDLCTGSGCIIISIALLGKPSFAEGIDISEAALKVAKENAKRLSASVYFHQSDFLQDVSGIYDVIVSNPPYIPTGTLFSLMPEVGQHEPKIALDGGEDGLYFYHMLARQSKAFLSEEGLVLMEIGSDQGGAVREIFLSFGFYEVTIYKDLAGCDRVVSAYIGKEKKVL